MMLTYLFILLLAGSCPSLQQATEEDLSPMGTLCRPDLCPNSEVHVGCFSNKKYGRKCGKVARVIHVDGGLRMSILASINMLRNYIASGMSHFAIAARMPMMDWDFNLQRLADLQARQCDEHSKFCANTDRYHYVATTEIQTEIGKHTSVKKVIINKFLPELFTDVLSCRMDSEHRLLPKKQGTCVGHYAPLLEDRGNRMGCAVRVEAQIIDENEPKNSTRKPGVVILTLICHFSRANVNNLPHYDVSDYPGRKCFSGSSQLYAFLCNQMEIVDSNSLIWEEVPLIDDVETTTPEDTTIMEQSNTTNAEGTTPAVGDSTPDVNLTTTSTVGDTTTTTTTTTTTVAPK